MLSNYHKSNKTDNQVVTLWSVITIFEFLFFQHPLARQDDFVHEQLTQFAGNCVLCSLFLLVANCPNYPLDLLSLFI